MLWEERLSRLLESCINVGSSNPTPSKLDISNRFSNVQCAGANKCRYYEFLLAARSLSTVTSATPLTCITPPTSATPATSRGRGGDQDRRLPPPLEKGNVVLGKVSQN